MEPLELSERDKEQRVQRENILKEMYEWRGQPAVASNWSEEGWVGDTITIESRAGTITAVRPSGIGIKLDIHFDD